MARIAFTPHLAMHLNCPPRQTGQRTLRAALDEVFAEIPKLRGYLLDDQDCIRQHVAIFIDGQLLRNRDDWDCPLTPESDVFVMQALSGG